VQLICPFRTTRRTSKLSSVATAACMSTGASISIRRPQRSKLSWSEKWRSAWKPRRNASTSLPKASM
jgi:hypothetical protein